MRNFSGRVMETILSLRFFIFQYGIVYKLNVQGDDRSLTVNILFVNERNLLFVMVLWIVVGNLDVLTDALF